jgi:hypothetical protein
MGVQFVQNAQNLHRREPRQGCEGLEIDEDDRRGRFSESGRAAVRVNPTAISRVRRLMTHEPKTSNGDQEPAMAIIIGVERRVTLEWSRELNAWMESRLNAWSRSKHDHMTYGAFNSNLFLPSSTLKLAVNYNSAFRPPPSALKLVVNCNTIDSTVGLFKIMLAMDLRT